MTAMLAWLPDAGVARLLVDVLWQGALAGGLMWVVLRGLQPRACLRSAALWWGLLAMVVAPAVTWAVRSQGGGLLVSSHNPQSTAVPAESRTGVAPSRIPAVRATTDSGDPRPAALRLDHEPAATGAAADSSPPSADVLPRRFGETSPSSLARALAVAWALGSLVYLIRLARSARRTSLLWRSAAPLKDDELAAAVDRTAARLGLRRVPAVRQSSAIASPAVIGWGAPRLLWPAAGVPTEQRQAVLWHELAHLARGDGWGLLMAELVVAAIPFQPWAAILKRRYRQACEEACDDWVLAGGVAPLELAELLTHWLPGPTAPLSLAMAESPAAARARILRLLNLSEPPRPTMTRLGRSGLVALALGLTLAVGLLQVRRAESQPTSTGSVSTPPSADAAVSETPAPAAPSDSIPAPSDDAAVVAEPLRLGPGDEVSWQLLSLLATPERRLEPGDSLWIHVANTLPDAPVREAFPIDSFGYVNFAPVYGRLELAGKTVDEASDVVGSLFRRHLREPQVSIRLVEHFPDALSPRSCSLDASGTLSVPRFGRFDVAGLSLDLAREKIVREFAAKGYRADLQLELIDSPRNAVYLVVSYVDPGGANAAPSDRGTEVQKILLSYAGSPQTVLDVIASRKLRIGLRPSLRLFRTKSTGQEIELSVNWPELASGRSMATNYTLQAGDRLHVEGAWETKPAPVGAPGTSR